MSGLIQLIVLGGVGWFAWRYWKRRPTAIVPASNVANSDLDNLAWEDRVAALQSRARAGDQMAVAELRQRGIQVWFQPPT